MSLWGAAVLDSRFSNNVVSFSRNLALSDHLFSLNSVPKPRTLSVRAVYVFSSLHLSVRFFRKNFRITQDQILRKIFGIEIESHRRCAIMNWNQLDRLISEIPKRITELEKHMSLVDELEQKRQIDAEFKEQVL
jgi:hypothetical protein